jgi:aspartate ammonia-lyase
MEEQKKEEEYRLETDLISETKVPINAYYGVQTLRGIDNFKITRLGINFFPNYIKSLGIVKKASCLANYDLKLITEEQKNAICQACDEIIAGKFNQWFTTDLIEGGAGTSINMNANEVIANRALEIMGHKKGEYKYCSPNDVVNKCQSTNDVFPTSFHLGLYLENVNLELSLKKICDAFSKKAEEFKDILKMGRTQLQDAVPMTLGQTFQAYAASMQEELRLIEKVKEEFLFVNLGGTAIGTGICSTPGYREKAIEYLRKETGLDIKSYPDLIFATSDSSPLVLYSSQLKHLALKLNKICNDLRLLSSGPTCGLREINLPRMQPGSSIMPGKVNPVIPEVVNQVCYKVIGNDLTVTLSAENAQLELNVMEPVMIYCIFESIDILTNVINSFVDICISGITANKDVCENYVKKSIGIVTALNPYIGYKNSTKLAKEAQSTGKGIYELVLEHNVLSKEDLDTILKPENMVAPVQLDIKSNIPHEY